MIRPLIIALLVFWAGTLRAEVIRIDTGEHGGFTRLVAYLPNGAEWDFHQDDGANVARLSVSPKGHSFDLEKAFAKITRDRIGGLSAEDGTLSLSLNCPCSANPFEYRDGIVVIDVSQATPLPMPDPEPPRPEINRPTIALPLQPRSTRLVHAALRQGLLEAQETGLLDAPAIKPKQVLATEAISALEPEDHIEIVEMAQNTCLPEPFFDVQSWHGDKEFSEGRSAHHDRLVDARGAMIGANIKDLARFYLAFGLWQEAEVLLHPIRTREADTLRAIAGTLAGQTPVAALRGQLECDTAGALWDALANGLNSKREAEAYADSLLQHFSNLPDELQTALLPRLTEVFAEAQADDTVARLLTWAERRTTVSPHENAILTAQTAPDADSYHTLSEVATQSGHLADQALLAMFSNFETAGHATKEDRILLNGYFKMNDAPQIGTPEWGAHLRLSVVDRDIHPLLTEIRRSLRPRPAVIDTSLDFVASQYGDIDFLKLALALEAADLEYLRSASDSLLDRLTGLGFTPEMAVADAETPS